MMRKKKYTLFRPMIRSRHPSHSILRNRFKHLKLLPFKSVIRLGSSTQVSDSVSNGGKRVELNTIKAIRNSSNKLKMKKCFLNNEVKTAITYIFINNNFSLLQDENRNIISINDLNYPIISKSLFGSRGKGNIKHDSPEELQSWLNSKNNNVDGYIFEKYYNYAREYRLHVNSEGCFYTCRKMIKRDTEDSKKWYRNDDNCVWIREDSESNLFDKPVNWDDIVENSVKALKSVGLDFGAIDLRVQSATNSKGKLREEPDFIVVEINSAPSFGDNSEELTFVSKKYIEEIPKMLKLKYAHS